jgi:hypothetical protein
MELMRADFQIIFLSKIALTVCPGKFAKLGGEMDHDMM